MERTSLDSNAGEQPEKIVKDIRQMMERSSRFISLSGLSGIAAGCCAIGGALVARNMLSGYYGPLQSRGLLSGDDFSQFKIRLLLLAVGTFVAAFLASFYFTWRRARRQQVSIWGYTSRKLFWNMVIPLATGAAFILAMLRYDDWTYVSSACLIFYGLALVNSSKYTLTDVRYLGVCEIILGLANMVMIGYGWYFWVAGFGILHIIYGATMWMKYERGQ